MRKRINWSVVASNVAEAREELEYLEAMFKVPRLRHEGHLQVRLEHAIHHLYFAWNVRCASTAAYVNMTRRDYNRWSKIPKDLEVYYIRRKRKEHDA